MLPRIDQLLQNIHPRPGKPDKAFDRPDVPQAHLSVDHWVQQRLQPRQDRPGEGHYSGFPGEECTDLPLHGRKRQWCWCRPGTTDRRTVVPPWVLVPQADAGQDKVLPVWLWAHGHVLVCLPLPPLPNRQDLFLFTWTTVLYHKPSWDAGNLGCLDRLTSSSSSVSSQTQ